MDISSLISQIQMQLGFRDDLDEHIVRELQLAQYELERDVTFNPWFLWRAKDICIKPDCLNYALPAGFIRLDETNNPLYHHKGSCKAYELNRGLAVHAYAQDNSVGFISHFTIQAKNLRLSQRGDGILRMFYITASAPLSLVNTTNLWTVDGYDVLMNKAGRAMANAVRDRDAIRHFETAYAESLINFKRQCIAYEDFGRDIARLDNLYLHQRFTGGWYDPLSGGCEPCGSGGAQ